MQKSTTGDALGAIEDFDKAIELQPDNPSLYFTRAIARDMNGNYAGAIADYETAVVLDPSLEPGLKDVLGHLRDKAGG